MARLTLADSIESVIIKMADGNPGAMEAVASLIAHSKDSEGFSPEVIILILDDLEIYGTSLYVLWNDQCGRDTSTFIMLIEAYVAGLVDRKRLQKIARDQMCLNLISGGELSHLGKMLQQFKQEAARSHYYE